MDALMTIFTLLFLFGIGSYLLPESKKKGKKTSVLYGYPAGNRTWLTVYHRRSTDEWIFEWDDLFDEGRPKSWGNITQDLMYPDYDEGATEEEIRRARAMVKKRFG